MAVYNGRQREFRLFNQFRTKGTNGRNDYAGSEWEQA